MLRIFSYRYTRNTQLTNLVSEAEEKGKRSSISASSDTAPLNRIQTPARSSISSHPISPVSSFPQNEVEGADATISNGSRGGSERGLRFDPPPYMPDLEAGRMEGHAGESNETRLSGYVKNQSFPGVSQE
jgi:hypothetical protein